MDKFTENTLVEKDLAFNNYNTRYLSISETEYFVLLKYKDHDLFQLYHYINNEEQFFGSDRLYLNFDDLEFIVAYFAEEFGIETTIEELKI